MIQVEEVIPEEENSTGLSQTNTKQQANNQREKRQVHGDGIRGYYYVELPPDDEEELKIDFHTSGNTMSWEPELLIGIKEKLKTKRGRDEMELLQLNYKEKEQAEEEASPKRFKSDTAQETTKHDIQENIKQEWNPKEVQNMAEEAGQCMPPTAP
ncbi:hypothetical protein PIB30_049068 [Stylosanthes scabra]|uniref:Uncharacterized protein n=1 Tax=Stylosanthes scabra TaxID=79078 RepID=A0ABU6XII2_9FABA|nr:hypothetical protein [Stylosanthes scabra]